MMPNKNSQAKSEIYPHSIKARVAHIGVGAFHRAHQAVFFDELYQQGIANDWGIIGINLRPQDSGLMEKINQRNGCYYLKTMSSDGKDDWREIHAIQKIINAYDDPKAAFAFVAAAETALITMTVTEGGYYTNEANQLDALHPTIQAEIDDHSKITSIYSFLRQALMVRMAKGDVPVTIACCDNLRHNGQLFQRCFYGYLDYFPEGKNIMAWLDKYASFPCSMVDRITPRPTDSLYAETKEIFQISNDSTIMAEDFIQWVI